MSVRARQSMNISFDDNTNTYEFDANTIFYKKETNTKNFIHIPRMRNSTTISPQFVSVFDLMFVILHKILKDLAEKSRKAGSIIL